MNVTHNFFIEYKQKWNNRCINTCIFNTDSDVWIIATDEHTYYKMLTKDLLKLVHVHNFDTRTLKDTDHITYGFIVPKKYIFDISTKYENKASANDT